MRMHNISPEGQAVIDAAAQNEAEKHAALEAALAKFRRVRSAASIQAATNALRIAREDAQEAIEQHAQTRQGVMIAEFTEERIQAHAKSARNYLYEATMSDYSVDSIRYGERAWADIKAVAAARNIHISIEVAA